MAEIDKEYMEGLYRKQKILVEDVEWDQVPHSSGRYSMDATVRTEDRREILTLKGEYWAGGKYSFGLHYSNTMIRVWDFNQHHEGIDGGHKHRYPHNELIEGEEDPYDVNHIPTSDPNQAVKEFIDECEIKVRNAKIHQIPNLENYE